MTNEEVIGAFHFFGPELYQLISGKVFDIEASDFNENGKFRRLNRQNPNGNAVSEGRPDQVTSLYAYTWAERTRWIQYYEQQGMDSDRKSTRLNSSHVAISYAVFCLKKKTNKYNIKRNVYRFLSNNKWR